MKKQNGFTLIELLVAIIMGTVFVGLWVGAGLVLVHFIQKFW